MVKFKAKIRGVGSSWVITIPKDFIDNGYITTEKEYWFDVSNVSENSENIQNKEVDKNAKDSEPELSDK